MHYLSYVLPWGAVPRALAFRQPIHRREVSGVRSGPGPASADQQSVGWPSPGRLQRGLDAQFRAQTSQGPSMDGAGSVIEDLRNNKDLEPAMLLSSDFTEQFSSHVFLISEADMQSHIYAQGRTEGGEEEREGRRERGREGRREGERGGGGGTGVQGK
jgi:hypothetical protein